MLSAFGPQVRKHLWWKKYLTILQLAQFVAIVTHAFQLYFVECDFPKVFVWVIGSPALMFFFLFSDFYKKVYVSQETNSVNRPRQKGD